MWRQLGEAVEAAMEAAGDCAGAHEGGIAAVLGFSSDDPRRGRVLFTDGRANPVLFGAASSTQECCGEMVLPKTADCTPGSDPRRAAVGAAIFTGAMAELAQRGCRAALATISTSWSTTPWSGSWSATSGLGWQAGPEVLGPPPSTTAATPAQADRGPCRRRRRNVLLVIASEVAAVAQPHHRVVGAVDHDRGRGDAPGVPDQASGAEDGVELAQQPCG